MKFVGAARKALAVDKEARRAILREYGGVENGRFGPVRWGRTAIIFSFAKAIASTKACMGDGRDRRLRGPNLSRPACRASVTSSPMRL